MDPIPAGLLPQSDDDKFLSCSHEERWNHLKPVIVELYTGRNGGNERSATLDQVVEFMRTHYSFHAACSEYPPRFRLWGVGKRMVKEDKDAIIGALARRKRPAASMSDATTQHNGQSKALDHKKLKRHLMSMKACLEVAPGLLSSWNLPYAALVASLPKNPDEPSPFGPLGPTPDYLHIKSPEEPSPGRETAGPSPKMQLVYEKHKEHCTSLFLQGHLKQLLIDMRKEDRRTMVNYFHDFYMNGLILAKNWNQELLNPIPTRALALTPQISNPWTPSAFLNLSSGPSSPEVSNISCPPTQLCKWSIHVKSTNHVSYGNVTPTSFIESLHQSMASNDFTTTPKADLPLAQDMIAKSLEGSPSPLRLDAWKLAIMAGNVGLLFELYRGNDNRSRRGIEAIYPFHLAAAFLDGGNECCGMFTALSKILPPPFTFSHNIDDLGHTILDALVVSILRSHTSVHPDDVSYGFQSPNRFPGEEKDICGRWDASSSNVRELFKQGYARIPAKWKHPFCHTAVQAVCHSIIAIFASPTSPNINAQSGLFVRRCTTCGLELKLGPLHTLVVAAFYLAQSGMPEETLFGALAVMVCLITLGADVSAKVNVSVAEILKFPDDGQCRHTALSPLELMKAVPGDVVEAWSEKCRTGWSCLIQVFALAVAEKRQKPSSPQQRSSMSPPVNGCLGTPVSVVGKSSDVDSCDIEFERRIHNYWLELPCTGPRIGLLWASIQTELLTYRRLSEGEGWVSENFSMDALKAWLEGHSSEFSTPLVQNQMFKAHTRCGWFNHAPDFLFPNAEEVCAEYFMNMDVYGRASYIRQPDLLGSFRILEYMREKTGRKYGEMHRAD
ncbi:Clr5 domain-containing protein [Fusarium falciforme]|uniref:Clr5 domain-containing protein n=1 Tax=Fusarium falciforme TaxID=195108 RepID=UPI002300F727|nr:Clr5 domain-containing protein [Fusarium falciforme]WAO86266.1 Clr5 domain-containing protein [Fusarium falciforme]